MGIMLPVLQTTHCRNLTVCGRLISPDDALAKRLAGASEMVARYRSGRSTGYIRVYTGRKPGKHLHVDCALEGFFPKGHTPKVSHRKPQVTRILETAYGHDMDAGVVGYFVVKLDELPERGMIRSLRTRATSGDLSIDLTGARLSLKGTSVREIEWSIVPDGDQVRVKITADRATRVSESYLQDALNWVEEQMGLFILGRSDHATG